MSRATRKVDTESSEKEPTGDILYIRSVEKAFRVLSSFDARSNSLSLSQLMHLTGYDKSSIQRLTHTLTRLGYLRKNPSTKHYELTSLCLNLGYRYTSGDMLITRAFPYLLHLGQQADEAVSLTMLEGVDVIYVSRIASRHMVNTDVVVGSRLPAYCTAPGLAMLSRLDLAEARDILDSSNLRSFTPATIWSLPDLLPQIRKASDQGYAMVIEGVYLNDISIAAAIVGPDGKPKGAVSIGVSKLRFSPDRAEEIFAPLVVATAQSLSMA